MRATNHYWIPLPWHRTLWKAWYEAARLNKLPHALLLKGSVGSGKLTFIKAFAKLMLCSRPAWLKQEAVLVACGQCTACLSYEASAHPNYYEIKPKHSDTARPTILIDQIRELTYVLQNTATTRDTFAKQHAYHTLVVISSMDFLNTAQHALLKTLEEPRLGVLFLLASARPQALAPTIRSRCQCVFLPGPHCQQSIRWLKSELLKSNTTVDEKVLLMSLELSNSPIQALTYLKDNAMADYYATLQSLIHLALQSTDPLEAAEQWVKYPLEKVLTYLMYGVSQLIQRQLGAELENKLLGLSSSTMIKFFNRVSPMLLFQFWDKLNEMNRDIMLYNLNPRISLEMLAYTFSNSQSLACAR